MTRKDYVLLAAALREARPLVIPGSNVPADPIARSTWYNCCSSIAIALKNSNRAFDSERFFDACGVPS